MWSAVLYNPTGINWKDVVVTVKEFGFNGTMNVRESTDVGPVNASGAFSVQVCWRLGTHPDEPYRHAIEYAGKT